MKKTLFPGLQFLISFIETQAKVYKNSIFLHHAEFKNGNRYALHSAPERRRISSRSGRSR